MSQIGRLRDNDITINLLEVKITLIDDSGGLIGLRGGS